MSSYILVGGNHDDKRWWNDLIRACAAVGETFEIHCWSDEKAEIAAALKFGQKVKHAWSGGTVIRGTVTREFLNFLTDAPKPTDTQAYNKMTPYFTIIFGKHFHSEHYGTEIIISKADRPNQAEIDKILDRMESVGTVHRNLG